MLVLSLLLNVVVLVPVCLGLLSNAEWATVCYGADSPGRRILLSVYLAIGLTSVIFLFVRQPTAIAALLAVQIIYKLTTPFTVGTFANPVVISNLGIAAFHVATLAVLWRSGEFSNSISDSPSP